MMDASAVSRRTLLRLAAGAAAGAAAGLHPVRRVAGQEKKPTLGLLTWPDYAPAPLVAQFEKDTGIKVTVAHYASNAELAKKLPPPAGVSYDLVQPTLSTVPAGVDRGLYRPLEEGRLRHLGRVVPGLLRAGDDLGGVVGGARYGVPFIWSAEGLAYHTGRLRPRPDSWGVLHDPAHQGRISYRATFHVFVSTGLWLGLGDRMRELYASPERATEILDQVLDRLAAEKTWVRAYWRTAAELETLMADGQVHVAQAWDGTAWRLERQGQPVRFAAPREGALAWMDGFAIPWGAKNLDEAYAWIDFMYEPRNAAALATDLRFGPVVTGAVELLDPALRRQREEAFGVDGVANLWWYPAEPAWWPKLFRPYVARLTGRPVPAEKEEKRATKPETGRTGGDGSTSPPARPGPSAAPGDR
jgi:spermidine/putrescine transport system substrate-binding protein